MTLLDIIIHIERQSIHISQSVENQEAIAMEESALDVERKILKA